MLHARSLVIGGLCTLAVVVPVLYVHDGALTARIDSLDAVVREAQGVRHAAIESVTVYVPGVARARAESDRLASVVRLVGPTSVAIRTTPTAPPVVYTVPPEVVERMRQDSTTIALQAAQLIRLSLALAADSGVINAQATEIRVLKRGRRCGPKCGGAIALGGLAVLGLGLNALP